MGAEGVEYMHSSNMHIFNTHVRDWLEAHPAHNASFPVRRLDPRHHERIRPCVMKGESRNEVIKRFPEFCLQNTNLSQAKAAVVEGIKTHVEHLEQTDSFGVQGTNGSTCNEGRLLNMSAGNWLIPLFDRSIFHKCLLFLNVLTDNALITLSAAFIRFWVMSFKYTTIGSLC